MGSDTHFDVEAARDGGRLVVAPRGELDIASVGRVRDVIAQREAGEDLRLDLSGLDFLDTSGLQLVVELHKQARADGFAFEIVRGTRNVQRVFEIAGLEAILPFAPQDR